MIHEDMKQLPIFADYHDGSPPYYLGMFDFTKPLDSDEPPPPPPPPEEEKPEGEAAAEPDAAEEAGEAEAEDTHHKVEITLLPNRQPEAKNPKTGERFKFIPRKDIWKADENPFSGAH
jgi:hypothetical protein